MDIDGNSPPFFHSLNGPSPSVPTPVPPTILPPLNDDADALNLRHLLSVARRRIFVFAGVSIAVACGVLVKVLTQTPIYEGNFRLLVEPIKGQDNLEQLNQALTRNTGRGENLDYETQIEVLLSSPAIHPIFSNIQQNYPELKLGELIRNLSIRRLKSTKILDIRYQDTDPQKIQLILKEVATGYIHYSEMEQQTTLRQGLDFVETQLPRLQQRVDTLQEYLEKFRQHYNLIDPGQSGQILSQQIGSLVQERQATESQLVQAQALYGKLRGQLGLELEQAMLATSLSQAPRYQDLLNRFHEIEAKLAQESTRFTVQSPAMQALIDERNSLLPLLQEEA